MPAKKKAAVKKSPAKAKTKYGIYGTAGGKWWNTSDDWSGDDTLPKSKILKFSSLSAARAHHRSSWAGYDVNVSYRLLPAARKR